MEKYRKYLGEVLPVKLNDFESSTQYVEGEYKKDENCLCSLEEIFEKLNSIDISIDVEKKKYNKKIDKFCKMFVLLSPVFLFINIAVLSRFVISMDIVVPLVCIVTVILMPSSYDVYCKFEKKKSNKIISSYIRKRAQLIKEKEEYLKIMFCQESKCNDAYDLATIKEKDTEELKDVDITCEVNYGIEKNIVEERPYIRKLERK